ncbi:hypothetical protein BDA96_09G166200 [Sorghum bicolor]|nr:hypothetical protein BDA96_09G166200 [Sorghum bicolor]
MQTDACPERTNRNGPQDVVMSSVVCRQMEYAAVTHCEKTGLVVEDREEESWCRGSSERKSKQLDRHKDTKYAFCRR